MDEFKSFYVDAEEGIIKVNGETVKNVAAFSATFIDGEYGLKITHDDIYTSKVHASKIFVDLSPDKVFNQGATE